MTVQPQLRKRKFSKTEDSRGNLPTMYDLPSENPEEPGVPDQFHTWQSDLLSQTFLPPDYPSNQWLVASDLNLYYDVQHPSWYKRPDWYAVLGGPDLYEEHDIRLSYVIWQEKKPPNLVVELLSPSTEKEDLGLSQKGAVDQPPGKWEVYEQILKIPYYVVFSRYTDELRVFELIRGRYQELPVSKKRIWLPKLKLGLGLWRGKYGTAKSRQWLRWYDSDDNWIPTSDEKTELERQEKEMAQQHAEQQRQRAEQERQQKEIAQQRAERLLAQLKALGVDPEA